MVKKSLFGTQILKDEVSIGKIKFFYGNIFGLCFILCIVQHLEDHLLGDNYL